MVRVCFSILSEPCMVHIISDVIRKSRPKCLFAFGPHQKWCEMQRKNVLSCVVHTISGVIRNS